jgi:serine protease Do
MQIPVVLGSREGLVGGSGNAFAGMSLVPLDRSVRSRYQIPMGVDGVLVTAIKPGSQAEKDGFQVGDVIIQIENRAITTMSDVRAALRESGRGAKRVYVNRNGMVLLLIVQ